MLFSGYVETFLITLGFALLLFMLIWIIRSDFQYSASEARNAKIKKIQSFTKITKQVKYPTDKKDKKAYISYYFKSMFYINDYIVKVEYKYNNKIKRKIMFLDDSRIKREKIEMMMIKNEPFPIFVNDKHPWAIRPNIFKIN